MVYAYWKSGHHDDHAVFDMFFRKNPFAGEYTVFAGMEECVRFIQTFAFDAESIAFLKTILPAAEAGFFDFLAALDTSRVIVHSLPEGTVVFPRVPCLRVEGPLAICQLLETTLLNLTNFASLMATNACRFRQAAGPDVGLVEFGLRRAQGPDGALSASRYAYVGGFDATSNLSAAMLHGIEARGTHAHSFVSAFTSFADLRERELDGVDMVKTSLAHREAMGFDSASDSELAAFIAYALAFPDGFLALVDTYDTLQSGVPNFLSVAAALQDAGHTPKGIRLDSGDLAYLSKEARAMFREAETKLAGSYSFAKCMIMASNDINEAVLHSLNDQGHELDALGVGTHLVTCQRQPALGMVYKLVEIEGKPRIKISQDISKVTIPGAKNAFRLIGKDNVPILDLLVPDSESPPAPGRRLLCHHPFEDKRRVYVTATKVIRLLNRVWVGAGAEGFAAAAAERADAASAAAAAGGAATTAAAAAASAAAVPSGDVASTPAASKRLSGASLGMRSRFASPTETRAYVKAQIALLRTDHVRPLNPTPYKVSVTAGLFHYIHELWGREVPVTELS
jgi:nicotinate phosphoribosyltransferase